MAIVFHPLMRTTTTKLYVYEPGTTTDKTVYSDSAMTVAHSQPITSASNGVFAAIYGSGTMRLQYKDSDDVLIENGDFDDVAYTVTDGAFSDYAAGTTYALGDVRTYSSEFYISIQGSNTGNTPSSTPTYWSKLKIFQEFNTNETYGAGDVAVGSDNALYASQAGSNTGNDPTSDTGANWRRTDERRWKEVAASYTVKAFEMVIPDNSAGAATVTLPASPVEGDWVEIRQKYSAPASTYSITVARNGNPIVGAASDLTIATNDKAIRLIYIDDATGWRVDLLGETGEA